MIEHITANTKRNVLKTIVSIHKQCVSCSNSPHYSIDIIKEWLSQISVKNVINQLAKTSEWIISEEKNQIVGFAQYSLVDKEIYQIQILPSEQGGGYGKKLYQYIEKDFKKNNVKQISLYSTLNAISFYKSLGFKSIGKKNFKLVKTSVEMEEMRKELE